MVMGSISTVGIAMHFCVHSCDCRSKSWPRRERKERWRVGLLMRPLGVPKGHPMAANLIVQHGKGTPKGHQFDGSAWPKQRYKNQQSKSTPYSNFGCLTTCTVKPKIWCAQKIIMIPFWSEIKEFWVRRTDNHFLRHQNLTPPGESKNHEIWLKHPISHPRLARFWRVSGLGDDF